MRRLALASSAVGLLALLKLALHLGFTGRFGYGFFVDELYFLACAEHLDWGFVDMPPLFPALTAALRATLGDSLLAVRLLPACAGAALVLLTGALARRMSGGPFAGMLAALAVVTAPIYLTLHSLHTMNALEPLCWMGCALLVLRLADGGDPRLWLAVGALSGLGLLNKHSMAFFGLALVIGVLATPLRAHVRTRWPWLGGLVALAIFLPNLLWLVRHRFPHLEMLARIRADGRDVALTPWELLAQQALMLHPAAAPLWIGGLYALLFGSLRRYRVLGVAYLALMAEMVLLRGRPYYPAPAYPMLLAAGAVAFEGWAARRALSGTHGHGRGWRNAYAGVLACLGVLLMPIALPCLPPEAYVRYVRALGVDQPRIENHRLGPLPQLHADRFGWPEMAAEVARVYRALPPDERPRAAIFGQNYGQAGAVDLFGPALGLPKALSGHLTYHAWGPRGYTGEVVIVLDDDRETLERLFESVELAGHVEHRFSMPYQHFDVFVCRRMREPLAAVWPRLRELG